MHHRVSIFVAVGLWLSMLPVWPARASVVLAMDLAQLTAESDRIVVGEVLSIKSQWDKARLRISSTVDVKVTEIWKGAMPTTRKVTVVQPGGVVDDIEMRVHGMPAFAPGERAVLFLRGLERASLVGLSQGKRAVRFDATSKKWMAHAPDLSAVVQVDAGGKMRPAMPQAEMPLDDLKRRVYAFTQK